MPTWLVSSSNLDNVRRAHERLMWGFWDREAGEKQGRNLRLFIKAFNRIKPFDYLVFQIAGTGGIHGLGLVKSAYYDDQTPIWDKELSED
ncbi:MAG: hypothetical protein QXR65_05020 [Candidatus Bathyarchaeia archaeon]